jgi:arylsulfatase A-like enzyme
MSLVIEGKKLNFLCFVTDQMRADHMSCAANNVVKTPNIDRIARDGVRFNNAFVANPVCMPARATFFTGLKPSDHHVRRNGIRLDKRIPTVPQALVSAGYRTHSVGKLHLTPYGLPKGADPELLNPLNYPESSYMWKNGKIQKLPLPYYGLQSADFIGGHVEWVHGEYLKWLDRQYPGRAELLTMKSGEAVKSGAEKCWKMALPEELHYTKWIADRTIEFLQNHNHSAPFFLWCSFPDPHVPYAVPHPWCDMYNGKDVQMPVRKEGELKSLPPHYKTIYEQPLLVSGRMDPTKMRDEQLRDIIAMTYGMISFTDHHIGRVLDSLEKLGMAENTVVIFLSDHGDMMGDHWMMNKGPFHFNGLLKTPFIWKIPGQKQKNVVTDTLVSHLDFAPTILDLADVPIPEGEVAPEIECPKQPPPWPGNSLKNILEGKQNSLHDSILIENDEDHLGLKLRTLVTDRYKLTVYAGQNYGEMFDLKEDPDELHNLWYDEQHKNLKLELKSVLLEKIISTTTGLPRSLNDA